MKKVIIGLTTIAVLATSLTAGDRAGDRCGKGFHKEFSEQHNRKGAHHKKGAKKGPMKFVSQLTDLTPAQREKISTIKRANKIAMKSLRQNMGSSNSISSAISEKGLNREIFLASRLEQFKKKTEIKANFFESILATLTPKQILEFKSLIEARKVRKECGKNRVRENNTTAK